MQATRHVLAVYLLSFGGILVQAAVAQSVYGEVWGRLTSVGGTPVATATVRVTAVESGAPSTAKTDANGYFTISNLTADLYQIEIQADGFKRLASTIVVSADQITRVDAPLQVGDPNAIVETTAPPTSILKLDRTDVSTLFDSRTINELPLLDRNITRLQLLVPGAVQGHLFISPNQNPQMGTPVNINGQHFSGAAFQLDGTENRDPLEGIVVINPTLDSLREMKITTQGYSAEFGQATAGIVTIQTRSGGHNWHGDGFGYRRTGWGQATDPFAPAGVPPSKYIIFGGSLSGPIVQKKLFLFGDYEGTRSSQGADLLLNVPTPLVLSTCVGSKDPGSFCNLSEYANFIPPPGLHDDTQHNKQPFPNFEIPNSRISDPAVRLLALLPLANNKPADTSCGSGEKVCDNYLDSGEEVRTVNRFDVRADYNLSSAMRMFARYSFGSFTDVGSPVFGNTGGGAGANPLRFAGVAHTRNQGISTGFTYSFSTRTLTDFRFGYFRYRLNNDSHDFGQIPDVGLNGIFSTDPNVHDPFATGLPDIQIPGQQANGHSLISSIGNDYLRFGYSPVINSCNCPLREREQQFQFVNNWTRVAGKHIFHWGTDLRYLMNYRLASDDRRTGAFSFAPNITGLALATFLIGDVTSFARFVSTPAAVDAAERQKRFGFYGQDTWRVNSHLTLNYGLRWEIYAPQTVTSSGGFLIPDLNEHDPAAAFITTPHAVGHNGGVDNSLKNFGPRFGIAYLMNPTTVMRVGYGRSFDAGYAGDLFGIGATQNPPVTVDQQIEAGGFNLSGLGPPPFKFPGQSSFSLLDLASANTQDPTAGPSSGAILYALPSRMRVPTVDSWNMSVQHQLASHLFFELAYVGSKGTHVFADSQVGTYYDLNQTTLQGEILAITNGNTSSCRKNAIFKVNGVPTYCLTQPTYRGFYQRVEASPDPCAKKCFFDATLFPVRYFGNNANDNYHSLQGKVEQGFNFGYSFLAHYTWSKGLNYDADYFRVDPRVGYGPANFDITHRFVLTNIWELPIGRGKSWLGGASPVVNAMIGGWTLSAITVWRSGFAFTPSYRKGNCTLDTDGDAPCRANRIGLVHTSGSRNQYFTTTGGQPLPSGGDCTDAGVCGLDASTGIPVPGPTVGPWQRPGDGQIGNVGRNSLRGPGFFQSDVAVEKMFSLAEWSRLRFRADVFNVFNKVNLGNPNACVDCPGGGSINNLASAAMQRAFQFSLRYEF